MELLKKNLIVIISFTIAILFLIAGSATTFAYFSTKHSVVNQLVVSEFEDKSNIFIEWHDWIDAVDPVVEFNRIAWNNTTCTITQAGSVTTVPVFSMGNGGIEALPAPYAYISDEFTLDEIQDMFIGAKAIFTNSLTPCPTNRISDIQLNANPDPQIKNGKTYIKYNITLGWPTTEITEEGLKELDQYEPFHPSREGYIFTGWSEPELLYTNDNGDIYYRTDAHYKEAEKITLEWHDRAPSEEESTDDYSDFYYAGYANANNLATLYDTDGSVVTFRFFSGAKNISANDPYPYIYMSGNYTLDDYKRMLIGKKLVQHDTAGTSTLQNFTIANVIDVIDANDVYQGYHKYYLVEGWPTTEIYEDQLLRWTDFEPFNPVRNDYTFRGWSSPVLIGSNTDGTKIYKTVSTWIEGNPDKLIQIMWRDGLANGSTLVLNRNLNVGGAMNNKKTCTFTHADGTVEDIPVFNVGNDGNADNPVVWAYLPESYTEAELQEKFIGAELSLLNAPTPASGGYIKNVFRDGSDSGVWTTTSSTSTQAGVRCVKYQFTMQKWPITTIKQSELDNLLSVAPYIPEREGYRFDGWREPVLQDADFYVTYAKWAEITEDPNDMTLPAYAAVYGDTLVFGRGTTIPTTYQGVPLIESYRGIEDASYGASLVGWSDHAAEIKSVILRGPIAPKNLDSWFEGMVHLETIDLEKFHTANVTTTKDMFKGCVKLPVVDLSYLDLSRVTNTTSMFEGCGNLAKIFVNTEWTNANITESENMFKGCERLRGGNGYTYDPTAIDGKYAVIDSDMSPGYLTSKAFAAYAAMYGNDTLVFGRGRDVPTSYNGQELTASWRGIESAEYTFDTIPWRDYRGTVTSVKFDAIISPVSTAYWFDSFDVLPAIDLSKLDTSAVVDMTSMFAHSGQLKTVDISVLDTSNVKFFARLFYQCSSLESMDWSMNDTSSAEGMGNMFYECTSLKSVKFGGKFSTENVIRLYFMFFGCTALEELDLTSFNTPNVTQTMGMFSGCNKLKTIYAKDTFTVDKVTSGENMFTNNDALVGGCGTDFKSTGKRGTEYARVDKNGQPGYFTDPDYVKPDNIIVTWANGYNDKPIKTLTIDKNDLNQELVYPDDPERASYKFVGWSDPVTDEAGNITITATWEYVGVEQTYVEKLMDTMTLKEKVCQMFCVYPENLTAAADKTSTQTSLSAEGVACLQEYPFGGSCFFLGNINNSAVTPTAKAEKAKEFTDAIQAASKVPMFLTIDEEGGNVARIGGTSGLGIGYGNTLNPMALYETQGIAKAKENGKLLAQNCKALGFNWDFAPCSDIVNGSAYQVTKNPIWNKKRYYSTDYELGAKLIPAAIEGFHEEGVATAIKHFPGHGSVSGDSHYGAVVVNKSKDQLMNEDWLTFKAGIEAGTDAVMIGHLTVPAIDDKNATVSSIIVTDILRGELGFDGVIVTDAMNMNALVSQYGSGQAGSVNAAVDAVKAGNDLILMAGYPKACVDRIVALVESGDISEERINESVKRLLDLKYNRGILTEENCPLN